MISGFNPSGPGEISLPGLAPSSDGATPSTSTMVTPQLIYLPWHVFSFYALWFSVTLLMTSFKMTDNISRELETPSVKHNLFTGSRIHIPNLNYTTWRCGNHFFSVEAKICRHRLIATPLCRIVSQIWYPELWVWVQYVSSTLTHQMIKKWIITVPFNRLCNRLISWVLLCICMCIKRDNIYLVYMCWSLVYVNFGLEICWYFNIREAPTN